MVALFGFGCGVKTDPVPYLDGVSHDSPAPAGLDPTIAPTTVPASGPR